MPRRPNTTGTAFARRLAQDQRGFVGVTPNAVNALIRRPVVPEPGVAVYAPRLPTAAERSQYYGERISRRSPELFAPPKRTLPDAIADYPYRKGFEEFRKPEGLGKHAFKRGYVPELDDPFLTPAQKARFRNGARKAARVAKKGFGLGLGFANKYDYALKAFDVAEGLMPLLYRQPVVWDNPGGWILSPYTSQCTIPPTFQRPQASGNPSNNLTGCLSGQAMGWTYLQALGEAPGPSDNRIVFVTKGGLTDRVTWVRVYYRVSTSTNLAVVPYPSHINVIAPGAAQPNPNRQRYADPTAQPMPAPQYKAGHGLGLAAGFSDADGMPYDAPRIGPGAPAAQSRALVATSVGRAPWAASSPLPPSLPPHVSKPPPPRTRERKQRVGRKVGERVAKALDNLSEGSEAVKAIYDALPPDVKERWGCKKDLKTRQSGAGFGGQAGQYGLSATDCHLRAIYHNAHKLDMNKVAEGLIKNQIEDALIGRGQKAKADLTRNRFRR